MSSSNSLVNMDATTSVPDTDSTTDIVMEEIISNQPSAGNNQKDSLSRPILCEKCSMKSLTIRRLQKNNSYLRKTAQNLRERLNLVRMVTTILKLTITKKLLWKQLVISFLEHFLTKKVVEVGGGGGIKLLQSGNLFTEKYLLCPPPPKKKHGTHGATDTNQE